MAYFCKVSFGKGVIYGILNTMQIIKSWDSLEIWDLLRVIRVSGGYSIKEWARMCGVCSRTIQEWERGSFCPIKYHREIIASVAVLPGVASYVDSYVKKALLGLLDAASARYSLTYKRSYHPRVNEGTRE